MIDLDMIRTDVLVIGAGGAGCRAAIECAHSKCRVLLTSKYPVGKAGATVVAENFYVAPSCSAEPDDNQERYIQDMVKGGAKLCEMSLAKRLASDGWDRVRDLEDYGVGLRRGEDRNFAQVNAPGHSYARGLSPKGGGLGIMRALQREMKKYPLIQTLEDIIFTKILTNSGTVAGAMGLDIRKGKAVLVESKAILVATGGYSSLWSNNDVPCDCTGVGTAMAFNTGADLVDLEMLLFYPTVLIAPPCVRGVLMPHGLLIEQIQAKLLNGRFEEFVPEKIPTRDVMNSLIYREIGNGRGTPNGGVYLDLTRSSHTRDHLKSRLMTFLPEKYKYLLKNGIDITREPVEVAPMAHYTLGGLRINADCETRVRGLFAAGEVEGNVHGANRLGGNALPETQVFGARAGEMSAHWAKENDYEEYDLQEVEGELKRMETLFEPKKNPVKPSDLKAELQDIMWHHVGPERERQGLEEAVRKIGRMREQELPRLAIPPVRVFNLQWVDALEVSHMLDLSELVAKSALMREETRGHHYRLDFPDKDEKALPEHTLVRKEKGEIRLWTEPVEPAA